MCALISDARLCLLFTSDVHMHLDGFDHHSNESTAHKGLSRLATLVAQVRRERADATVLLFDNGDLLQGTVLGDIEAMRGADGALVSILHEMGYDALGLGNHDMDYGLGPFRDFCSALEIPLVCSNFDVPGTVPRCIIEREIRSSSGQYGVLRVGILSVLPPQTMQWNAQHLGVLPPPRDPVQSVRDDVTALRREGADIIVLLAHTGIAENLPDNRENFAHQLARVPGIDAMVCGHTHRLFPGTDHEDCLGVDVRTGRIGNVPAVMPGFGASHLGIIDIKLTGDFGSWAVKETSVSLSSASQAEKENQAVCALIRPLHEQARAYFDQVVGQTNVHLHSYFSALFANPGQHLIGRAMIQQVSRALRGTVFENVPVLAAAAPNAAGGRSGPANYLNVPPGPVLRKHLALISPFPNQIWALKLTGAQVRAWLERAVKFFENTSDAAPHRLLNPDFPSFNFDAVFGLNAIYDPMRGCVHDVTWNGSALEDDQIFIMATTSYRAAGGGGFPGAHEDNVVHHCLGDIYSALIEELSDRPVNGFSDSPWVLKVADDARDVIFETSPQALDHLSEIEGYAPRLIKELDNGFIQLQVTLGS